jgi:hypothetical protein
MYFQVFKILFPSGVPTTILYALLISPMRAICHIHFIYLDFVKRTSYELLHFAVFSILPLIPLPPLHPNIHLSTVFSKVLEVVNVWNEPNEFYILCIYIYIFPATAKPG